MKRSYLDIFSPIVNRIMNNVLRLPKTLPHYFISPEKLIDVPVAQERSRSSKEGDPPVYFMARNVYNCSLVRLVCTKGQEYYEHVLHYNTPENSQELLERMVKSALSYKEKGYQIGINLIRNSVSVLSYTASPHTDLANTTYDTIRETLNRNNLYWKVDFVGSPNIIIKDREVKQLSTVIERLVDFAGPPVRKSTHVERLLAQAKKNQTVHTVGH